MPDDGERGIVYVATGERYVREAEESARSVRKSNPYIPITLFTDSSVTQSHCFERLIRIC